MRWVDERTYIGPDRRESKRGLSLRLKERRRRTLAEPAPPLGAALRHLRVRVPELGQASGRDAFCRRALAVAALARIYRRRDIGDQLVRLVDKLHTEEMASDEAAIVGAYAVLDDASHCLLSRSWPSEPHIEIISPTEAALQRLRRWTWAVRWAWRDGW